MNMILEAAKDYLRLGFTPIPCLLEDQPGGKVNKRPLIPWRVFENSRPTEQQLEWWWNRWPLAQVGLVTGPHSDLFVVDVDEGATEADVLSLGLSSSTTVQTPSGGLHFYFRYPQGRKVKTITGLLPHIDVRGEGGFVVAPPSTYPDGRPYFKISSEPTRAAPEHLLAKVCISASEPPPRADLSPVVRGVTEGGRNYAAAQLVGLLTRYLPPRTWSDVVWPLVRAWNDKNVPPLAELELLSVFHSITRKELTRQEERDRVNAEMEKQYGPRQ